MSAFVIVGGRCWRRQAVSKTLGQSLESLSPPQRAERYRQFAEDALRRAAEAGGPDQRSEYIAMAAGWHTMALEAEKAHSVPPPSDRRAKSRAAKQKEQH